MSKNEVVRGRGRPAIYVGAVEKAIVKVIREHGLMRGRTVLSKGVQIVPGQRKRKLKVSLPTLGKLAKRNGIELTVGRPTLASLAA